jgi:hypothetical protein
MGAYVPWRTQNGVTTGRVLHAAVGAYCYGCDWSHHGPNHAANRKAAHRHIRRTGHEAYAQQLVTHQYAKDTTR